MVEILRKDNPSIQLHSTAVGFKASREERKNREAFMVAYFKSSDDNDSLYTRYRIKRDINEDEEELGGMENNLLKSLKSFIYVWSWSHQAIQLYVICMREK